MFFQIYLHRRLSCPRLAPAPLQIIESFLFSLQYCPAWLAAVRGDDETGYIYSVVQAQPDPAGPRCCESCYASRRLPGLLAVYTAYQVNRPANTAHSPPPLSSLTTQYWHNFHSITRAVQWLTFDLGL